MRYHGLVLVALLGVSERAFAQNGAGTSSPVFLPPSPSTPGASNSEPLPLPSGQNPVAQGNGSDATNSIEAELRQFRSELREFQALREEVARNTKSAEADTDRAMLQQRQELLDLLTKLAKNRVSRKSTSSLFPAEESESDFPDEPEQPMESFDSASDPKQDLTINAADPFALGKVLFRSGDFIGAEKAFRKATVAPENEMTLKYLLATCLRRQSQWKPAVDAYKVIAESNQDPVLRDLAKWQLDNIRWHQQSDMQLKELRKQREKQAATKKGVMPSAPPAGK